MTVEGAVALVREVIGDPKNRCYHASEAVYHLSGGQLKACYVYVAGSIRSHWFLRALNGDIVDPTCHQFTYLPNYATGRGCGFLTKAPSKVAKEIIAEVKRLYKVRNGIEQTSGTSI